MECRRDELFAVAYHDIFDFPLTRPELIRWRVGRKVVNKMESLEVSYKNGLYFLRGREGLVARRQSRNKNYNKKLNIAKKASSIIGLVPSVRLVAVTGALAMGNAKERGDIDLMIITKAGRLWQSRLFSYFVLGLMRFKLRRPFDKDEKDKLCLNIWLDEGAVVWPASDRNIYTAHEIGQIVPLVNKDNAYERFIYKNKWILGYWPNSVRVNKTTKKGKGGWKTRDMPPRSLVVNFIENLAFGFQSWYMKKKMTTETVTRSRALFHPRDWGKKALTRLGSFY